MISVNESREAYVLLESTYCYKQNIKLSYYSDSSKINKNNITYNY